METIEQYLSFIIDNRKFAFEAKHVFEVLIDRPISPIPQSEEYIRGVINYRGEVITVVDTSLKFGIKDYKVNEKRIIIIVNLAFEDKMIKLGCMCDFILRMESINYLDIKDVPSFGTYYNPELLKGVFYIEDELYSIIDIEKIFTSDEVLFLSEVNNNGK